MTLADDNEKKNTRAYLFSCFNVSSFFNGELQRAQCFIIF